MDACRRIIGMLVWLSFLAVTSAIMLAFASYRVGEHRSSTYGKAYTRFEQSWGGEIGIPPPKFFLERTFTEEVYDKVAKQFRDVERTERIPLIPRSLRIDADIRYGEQKRGWLTFNAFEAGSRDSYRVVNTTPYEGKLLLELTKPGKAKLMVDYTVHTKDRPVMHPVEGPMELATGYKPGDSFETEIRYGVKGMDLYVYGLSEYQHSVVEKLEADIRLDTPDFEIYRFGLTHSIDETDNGAHIRFNLDNFATTQDLGVTFVSRSRFLDRVHSLMSYAPFSPILLLLVVFIYSQVQSHRFNAFHYLFLAIIDVFYFLFVAYLIRFFNVGITFVLAAVMTLILFLVYCPSVFGRHFAFRVVGGYLFLLTVIFSLVFLMPIFRGILFLSLMFLVFLAILAKVGRSDISTWWIVTGTREPPPHPDGNLLEQPAT